MPTTAVGAAGSDVVLTLAEAVEAAEAPLALVALTVYVYDVPMVVPATAQVSVVPLAVVQVLEPDDEVAV